MTRSSRLRAALQAACWAFFAVLGTGCAMLPNASAPADGQAPAAAASAASAPEAAALGVDIVGPAVARDLLSRFLDIVRLGVLAPTSDLSAGELERLIGAVPAQASELLQTEGYFDANVRVETLQTRASDGAPSRVRVVVEPGLRTRVDRVNLEVEGDLGRSVARGDALAQSLLTALRASWPLKPGTPFRNPAWSDAKVAVLTRLRAAGYAVADWSGTTAQIDAANQRARLYLVADSGPLFRAGDLSIQGLKLQGEPDVRNLAGFKPGDPVTESLLLDFQDRLQKSGLFEQAAVSLETDPAHAGAATLQVRVRELARHQLTLGVGVSSNSGPRVTAEHVDRRLFGFAATARNKFEWGRLRQAWDGELSTHVRADGYRWFTGGTIERLKTDTDIVLSQRIRLGRASESPRIERIQYLEVDRAARRTELGRSVTEAFTANQGWLWRDIDNPLLPTDGRTLSLSLAAGQARGTGSGSSPLARVAGRAMFFVPLGRNWHAQLRGEAGQVFVRDAALVTDNMGFRAGGDESVRGYAYRSLGPLRDGAVASGRVMWTASAEVAHPILASMPSLWGAVFVDAGGAADTWRSLDPVVGSGVGLRWRSPVGPLKLDLAYGFAAHRVRLHFSVGIVF